MTMLRFHAGNPPHVSYKSLLPLANMSQEYPFVKLLTAARIPWRTDSLAHGREPPISSPCEPSVHFR